MAMDRLDRWLAGLKREAKREGRREGGARLLLRQLAARFGAVPAETKARVLEATGPMLSRWSIRVLTADTLDDVFSGSTKPKAARKAAASARRRPARKPTSA